MNDDLLWGIVTIAILLSIAILLIKVFFAIAGPIIICMAGLFILYKLLKFISK
jgi:di/tricarboxylate transporter